ncbi:MAG TPA: 50S ribosomal protein L11 methyltransferase [Chitinophagaceae bacterium]|nr:50S ribosomal protein L11 methyltransferase [Chitinophagaceae bacterium]
MNEYVQIEFQAIPGELKDILIAELSAQGFEGFEETENGLKAFISFTSYDEKALLEIAGEQNTGFNKTIIEETNWNEVWESNFEPVVVDDFVAVRAGFHKPVAGVMHEIIVTPKMSFGTGHHATTFMMLQQMREIEFRDKIVLDFGTGTGVLAILAEKLGAKKVIALDNDDWSIENAKENIKNNGCRSITLQKADSPQMDESFDIVLANINKNVIVGNFNLLMSQLATGGNLLLSGLLREDGDVIFHKTVEYSLHIIQTSVRDNWLCFRISC